MATRKERVERAVGRIVDRALERQNESLAAKGYSVVPVASSRAQVLRPGRTPSDQALLDAFANSPWLHIKVLRQCWALAGLEFVVGTRGSDQDEVVPLREDHPMWVLLRKPSPELNGLEFRFLSELYLRTVGAVYWRLVFDGLRVPRGMRVYPPHWVRPVYRRGVLESYEVWAPGQGLGHRAERVPAEEVLWLRTPAPMDPYTRGLGDVQSLATEVDTYELASESNRSFFQNDASPPGVLVVPGHPTVGERQRIADDWLARTGGERTGSVPVLSGGMDYKTMRATNREMEFTGGQRYLRDVIISGVHKHIVGITDDVTFAAAKAADYTFARWELLPRTRWWEETVNAKLSPLFDARAVLAFLDVVPQDEELELRRANEGLERGALTRNEWRRANGLDPVADGDVYLVASSIVEIPVGGAKGTDPNTSRPDGTGIDSIDTSPARAREETVPKAPAPARLGRRGVAEVLEAVGSAPYDELTPAYLRVLGQARDRASEELGLALPKAAPSSAREVAFLRRYRDRAATGVDQTTADRIGEALAEGVAEGEGVGELADRLTAVFADLKGSRAETVARTEVVRASNGAAAEAYLEAGVVGAIEWLVAPDYDEAQDHGACLALDGEAVPLGGEFAPGVPYPPLHPNCRCAVLPVVGEAADALSLTEEVLAGAGQLEGDQAGEVLGLTEEQLRSVARDVSVARGAASAAMKAGKGPEAQLEEMARSLRTRLWPKYQRWLGAQVEPRLGLLSDVRVVDLPGHLAASYRDGVIRLSRSKAAGIRRALSARKLKDREEGMRYSALFHEMTHALTDWPRGGVFFASSDSAGLAFTEAMVGRLGARLAFTVARASGVELVGTAASAVRGGPYGAAWANVAEVYRKLGLDANDPRVMARSLRAAWYPGPTGSWRSLYDEFRGEVLPGVTEAQFTSAVRGASRFDLLTVAEVDRLLAGETLASLSKQLSRVTTRKLDKKLRALSRMRERDARQYTTKRAHDMVRGGVKPRVVESYADQIETWTEGETDAFGDLSDALVAMRWLGPRLRKFLGTDALVAYRGVKSDKIRDYRRAAAEGEDRAFDLRLRRAGVGERSPVSFTTSVRVSLGFASADVQTILANAGFDLDELEDVVRRNMRGGVVEVTARTGDVAAVPLLAPRWPHAFLDEREVVLLVESGATRARLLTDREVAERLVAELRAAGKRLAKKPLGGSPVAAAKKLREATLAALPEEASSEAYEFLLEGADQLIDDEQFDFLSKLSSSWSQGFVAEDHGAFLRQWERVLSGELNVVDVLAPVVRERLEATYQWYRYTQAALKGVVGKSVTRVRVYRVVGGPRAKKFDEDHGPGTKVTLKSPRLTSWHTSLESALEAWKRAGQPQPIVVLRADVPVEEIQFSPLTSPAWSKKSWGRDEVVVFSKSLPARVLTEPATFEVGDPKAWADEILDTEAGGGVEFPFGE